MGLPNVKKRLAQFPGCHMRIVSAPGCGTTVCLSLHRIEKNMD